MQPETHISKKGEPNPYLKNKKKSAIHHLRTIVYQLYELQFKNNREATISHKQFM